MLNRWPPGGETMFVGSLFRSHSSRSVLADLHWGHAPSFWRRQNRNFFFIVSIFVTMSKPSCSSSKMNRWFFPDDSDTAEANQQQVQQSILFPSDVEVTLDWRLSQQHRSNVSTLLTVKLEMLGSNKKKHNYISCRRSEYLLIRSTILCFKVLRIGTWHFSCAAILANRTRTLCPLRSAKMHPWLYFPWH